LEDLDKLLNTSEYILECKNDHKKDYHQQMDSLKYINYFEKRLINSFVQNNNNNVKAIYYIDQAPFYVMFVGFPSSQCSKEHIVGYYDTYGIKQITLKRRTKDKIGCLITFNRENFLKHPNKKVPQNGGPLNMSYGCIYGWFCIKQINLH